MTQPLKVVAKTPLSSTDPVREQEDGWSIDQENGHFQRSCLEKSCFKSYQLMTKPLKMVAKTPPSSTDPVREQEDRWSLDWENNHFQRNCLEKSCFKLFHTTENGCGHSPSQDFTCTPALYLDLWRTVEFGNDFEWLGHQLV